MRTIYIYQGINYYNEYHSYILSKFLFPSVNKRIFLWVVNNLKKKVHILDIIKGTVLNLKVKRRDILEKSNMALSSTIFFVAVERKFSCATHNQSFLSPSCFLSTGKHKKTFISTHFLSIHFLSTLFLSNQIKGNRVQALKGKKPFHQ